MTCALSVLLDLRVTTKTISWNKLCDSWRLPVLKGLATLRVHMQVGNRSNTIKEYL